MKRHLGIFFLRSFAFRAHITRRGYYHVWEQRQNGMFGCMNASRDVVSLIVEDFQCPEWHVEPHSPCVDYNRRVFNLNSIDDVISFVHFEVPEYNRSHCWISWEIAEVFVPQISP